MKKSYIKCPYCGDEVSVSGSSMHVKNKHTDKFEEFKKKFEELKKSAIIKESTTKAPLEPGKEPPKIEDTDKPDTPKDNHPKDTPKDTHEDKDKPLEKPRGDDKPQEGKSFLKEFDDWWDSDKL